MPGPWAGDICDISDHDDFNCKTSNHHHNLNWFYNKIKSYYLLTGRYAWTRGTGQVHWIVIFLIIKIWIVILLIIMVWIVIFLVMMIWIVILLITMIWIVMILIVIVWIVILLIVTTILILL